MTISKEKLQDYLDKTYEDRIKNRIDNEMNTFSEGIIYQVAMLQNLLASGYFNKEKMQWHTPTKRKELNRLEREFCDQCTSCNTFEYCDTCELTENAIMPNKYKHNNWEGDH